MNSLKDTIIIKGGNKLYGSVEISGSKNAVLPIIGASLLADDPSRITRVPMLDDVYSMSNIIEFLGGQVTQSNEILEIDGSGITNIVAPNELVNKIRASYYFLAPLIVKYGYVKFPYPGGCVIGDRPIDLHLKGFNRLGAKIIEHDKYIEITVPNSGLKGAEITLSGVRGSSVGATCNVLMAAVLAKGKTVIHDSAIEPEVDDLVKYLVSMGSNIKKIGSRTLLIEGVNKLNGISYEIISDRIEAGTYLCAVAMTGGEITIERCNPQHLENILDKLKKMGASIDSGYDWIRISCENRLKPIDITTETYPGFPTDMQAQFMAALTLADGESTIIEKVFPKRFMHAEELKHLGANITVSNGKAIVQGVKKLFGTTITASDLRASASLLLAGLVAEGTTICRQVSYIDRGYDRFVEKMRSLGAEIHRYNED